MSGRDTVDTKAIFYGPPEILVSSSSRIEVYTDGQCPLCQWMRARVEPFDKGKRVEWIDYNLPENLSRAEPRTYEELADEMHVRTPDGRWSRGYAAWLEVLRVLPAWRWLVPLISVWPFTSLGPRLYRWLAGRRYKLFGIPPPCDPHGVCKLHQK